MQARRVIAAVLALGLLAALAAAGGSGAVAGVKPTGKAARVDLAKISAKRWIVQLRGAPLATYRGGVPGFRATAASATGASQLNVTSARSVRYVKHLKSVQQAFALRLHAVAPGAKVQRGYQAVLNGVAVKMSRGQAAKVRRMSGVAAVTPDHAFRLQMYATPNQIGAPTLWGQVGGQANAGAGVKVAIVDSGIFVRTDAQGNYAGNPCFNDAGYTAPKGYPKGETNFRTFLSELKTQNPEAIFVPNYYSDMVLIARQAKEAWRRAVLAMDATPARTCRSRARTTRARTARTSQAPWPATRTRRSRSRVRTCRSPASPRARTS